MQNYVDYLGSFFCNDLIALSSLLLALSFLSTFKMIPYIAKFSLKYNLTVKPNARSSHYKCIPQLGGLGISTPTLIFCLVVGSIILNDGDYSNLLAFVICLVILIAVGLKDDIIGLPAWVKLMSQLIASLFFIIVTGERIDNFYGIFGLYELPIIHSYLFTLFTFVIIINSYNLIDGIDGLAGTLAVLILTCFLLYFLETKSAFEVMVSSSLIGGLFAFLRYNFSKGKSKMFMGDVGSLVIGFLLAVMAVGVLSNGTIDNLNYTNKPVFVLALFTLPFLDTLRVFFIRALSGISPFVADKNHIHHRLFKYGLTHPQITTVLIIYSVLVIVSSVVFKNHNIHIHLLLTLLVSIILLLIILLLFYLIKKTKKE